MSRDWTPEEIQMVSEEMKAAGHMGFEEFCKALEEHKFELIPVPANDRQVTIK